MSDTMEALKIKWDNENDGLNSVETHQFIVLLEAQNKKLRDQLEKSVTVIELCDKWFQEIYPKDIFVGDPSADDGVNRVVEMREKAREFLSELEKDVSDE